jgi:integrase
MKVELRHIELYVDGHKLAWAETTLRSERARLVGLLGHLDGNPATLMSVFEARKTKPYTRVTAWTRVTRFYDWLIQNGHFAGVNEYARFRQANARQFKNAYVRKTPKLTFEQAEQRLRQLRPDVARLALEILYTGMRYAESRSHQDGFVVGKGGKTRRVYVPEVAGPKFYGSYQEFHRRLKSAGLKPHDLRKLALSRFVEKGANQFELMAVAGWSSLAPATSYISATEQRIEQLAKAVRSK